VRKIAKWPLFVSQHSFIFIILQHAIYFFYYGQIRFHDGFIPGIKAFTAAVLGGIGSLPGAVIGGLMIGLIESFWAAYIPSGNDYKDVAAFAILIVVLIFMPSGLLGRAEVEKV